jgi:hypothetical protein
MTCLTDTSGAWALRQKNLQKKSDRVSLSYCWHDRKSSFVLSSAWNTWKLTRNFSFRWYQDVIDVGSNIAYQFAATPSIDMINDLARVVSLPPDEAITTS